MKQLITSLVFFLFCYTTYAQELFPNTEPASTVPKGVLGVKIMSETYREVALIRNQFGLRVMYGLTPKLTVWAQPMLSNHHNKELPRDIVRHRHIGNNYTAYARALKYGSSYPYIFSGLHLYGKYRFLSNDEAGQHFRMALVGEYTLLGSNAHDEAEPHLQGDTGGLGLGFISTYLKNRLAISFTGGVILPSNYKETGRDLNYNLDYGKAINYSLSLGYQIYPRTYDNYNQSNYNLYVEFMGKAYEAATFRLNEQEILIESNPLQKGGYVDVYLGIQRIVRSNDRLEISVGLNLLGESYRHFYPVLNLSWQKYFYF